MKIIGETIIVRYHGVPQAVMQQSAAQISAAQSDSPAEANTAAQPVPTSILWRGRPYRVRAVAATWRWRGSWWTTPALQGQERMYFRLLCALPGGDEVQMEVFRERGRWTLSRLLD